MREPIRVTRSRARFTFPAAWRSQLRAPAYWELWPRGTWCANLSGAPSQAAFSREGDILLVTQAGRSREIFDHFCPQQPLLSLPHSRLWQSSTCKNAKTFPPLHRCGWFPCSHPQHPWSVMSMWPLSWPPTLGTTHLSLLLRLHPRLAFFTHSSDSVTHLLEARPSIGFPPFPCSLLSSFPKLPFTPHRKPFYCVLTIFLFLCMIAKYTVF